MYPLVNPLTVTAAGPLVSSWPCYYSGGYNRFGRWGWGPNYGTGWAGSWYNNPYGYMSGTYW
jgi:hypothetical protein